MSLLLDLNNPLGIKQPNGPVPWQGSDPKNPKDSKGHARFLAQRWSVRAGVRILYRYAARGNDTIERILAVWAPTSDTQGSIPGGVPNCPAKYANFVRIRAKVRENQPLELFVRRQSGLLVRTRGGGAVPSPDLGAPTVMLDPRAAERCLRVLTAMAIYEVGHANAEHLDWREFSLGILLYQHSTGAERLKGMDEIGMGRVVDKDWDAGRTIA